MNRYLVVFLDDSEGRADKSSHYMVEGKNPKRAFKRALKLHWDAKYNGFQDDDHAEEVFDEFADIGFVRKDAIFTWTGTEDSDALIYCIAENLK